MFQNDAFTRYVGQDVLGRQYNHRALARQPRIHVRVGVDELVIAQAILAGKIRKRIFLTRKDDLRLADDHLFRRFEYEQVRFERIQPGTFRWRHDRLRDDGRFRFAERRQEFVERSATAKHDRRRNQGGDPWYPKTIDHDVCPKTRW